MALDLARLVVLRQRTEQGRLVIEAAYASTMAACPHCGRATNKVHDRRTQRKRGLPIRGREVILLLHRRRFRCLRCTGRHRRPPTFTEGDPACGQGPKGRARRTTQWLREAIAQEGLHQTVKRVAKVYGVGQRFVRECIAGRAHREIRRVAPKGYTPRVLGLDEFSMKQGVRYETVFCDLEERRVLDVVEGRDGESVRPYLEGLRKPDRVAVAVMDMSEGYRQVVQLCLPRATIVVDRFHAVRQVGQALDRVRLRLQRGRGEERKGRLYRLRYALLKRPDEWTEAERLGLQELFEQLPELKRAWELKEEFRAWYDSPDRATAEKELLAWEQAIKETRPAEYRALLAEGSMLGSWREELLNYFDHSFTNGYTEGKNNRTKQLQRQAYGYRNRDNLRLRILLPAG